MKIMKGWRIIIEEDDITMVVIKLDRTIASRQ